MTKPKVSVAIAHAGEVRPELSHRNALSMRDAGGAFVSRRLPGGLAPRHTGQRVHAGTVRASGAAAYRLAIQRALGEPLQREDAGVLHLAARHTREAIGDR